MDSLDPSDPFSVSEDEEDSDSESLSSGEEGGLKTGVVVRLPDPGERVTCSSFGESGVLI